MSIDRKTKPLESPKTTSDKIFTAKELEEGSRLLVQGLSFAPSSRQPVRHGHPTGVVIENVNPADTKISVAPSDATGCK